MSSGVEKLSLDDLESARGATNTSNVKPQIDLSHHFSDNAKSRVASPLKDIFKFMAIPGIVMMAGGLPHPDYFPFDSVSAEVLVPASYAAEATKQELDGVLGWFWKLFGTSFQTKTMSIPKYAKDPNDVQLSTTLQYSQVNGLPALQNFIHDFTKSVYQPLNSDFQILVHAGNTDAWTKCVQTFCNPGELIITEDWAYVSALVAAKPYGVLPVGVAMDGEGMRADALEDLLTNWDSEARGAPRPHVMYTVPVGQNPCGTTMGAARKKAIYDICVKFDVIIIEDDPYYFLQVGEYNSPQLRHSKGTDDEREFIESLVPSYVKLDYQGRVVRLDTFSKTIAPGSRLGWYTCSPLFKERLERVTETSTQAPSGFSQAIITQLLTEQWKYSGWIRWLRGIRAQYTIRRDLMIDSMAKAFDTHEEYGDTFASPLTGSVKIMICRSKRHATKEKGGKILFSFVAPTAGMFLWLKVHLYNHPAFDANTPPPKTPAETLEFRLWEDLAYSGLLLGPGWIFGTDPDATLEASVMSDTASRPLSDQYKIMSDGGKYGHLRLSYSNPTEEQIQTGLSRLASVLDKHFFST